MKYSYTKEWLFLQPVLLVCFTTRFISAAVYLKPFSTSFIDTPAKFAAVLNRSGICGALHLADPLDACSPLYNAFGESGKINVVLIVRGRCAFEDKIRNAQGSGFRAAIVYDDLDRTNLISMLGNSEGISVNAVFISKGAGEFLTKHARGRQGECCIVPSIEDAAWTVLLISLISFVVILSVLAAFIIARNQRSYMRGVNHQRVVIDTKMVEVLPSFIFNSAHSSSRHTGETCAICLEDYKDGENLRVLPCQHEFHSKCVDSWLTKWGTFCPVCKHSMNAHFTSSKDTISL